MRLGGLRERLRRRLYYWRRHRRLRRAQRCCHDWRYTYWGEEAFDLQRGYDHAHEQRAYYMNQCRRCKAWINVDNPPFDVPDGWLIVSQTQFRDPEGRL